MAKIDLTSREWCELVFEGKNKDFGAYEMRMNSHRNHNKAMSIVLIAALLAFTLPSVIKSMIPEREETDTIMTATELSALNEPEVEKPEELIKPDLPPPPPLKSSVKFTPPVIVDKEEITEEDEIKTQDELKETEANISIADVVGNDEINGQDIADLEVIAAEPEPEEDNKIYDTVEQSPEFPGGMEALNQYLKDKLVYPSLAADMGVEGKVFVRFAVMKDGSVGQVKVSRSIDPALDQEAIRVVSNMPKWIPGKQNGVAVNVYYSVPVSFKLKR